MTKFFVRASQRTTVALCVCGVGLFLAGIIMLKSQNTSDASPVMIERSGDDLLFRSRVDEPLRIVGFVSQCGCAEPDHLPVVINEAGRDATRLKFDGSLDGENLVFFVDGPYRPVVWSGSL